MRRLLYFLMAMLGFGAVSCEELEGGGNLDAYGTPYSVFRVSLRVVDGERNPIPGIQVSAKNDYNTKPLATTNEEGRLEGTYQSVSTMNYINFLDTDGEANGGWFEPLSMNVGDKIVKVKDGEGWCRGEYEVTLGEVTLELKEESTNNE
uniref:radical SAM-associated putative lipoprotein n=1 Tax=Alistipes sp. TaxID=1872444 RepID=UPI00405697F1